MDPRATIRQLLSRPSYETYEILFDLLEEHGMDPDLLAFAVDVMPWRAEHMTATDGAAGVARLLGELAKTDYPRAVKVLSSIEFPERDYRSYPVLVDAINTAWFNYPQRLQRRRPADDTWLRQLDREKMEQVTMETGGDLGPWEGLVDDSGRETRRPYATDFAPEYLEHELEDEHGYESRFHTVYDESVGREVVTLRDSEGLWRLVMSFNAGAERECAWVGGDEGDLVTLEQTYHGGHPGRDCALCEAAIGEEHGNIYLGEIGGNVYLLDVAAGVTSIEIRERGETTWEIACFAGDDSVDVPDVTDNYYVSIAAAEAAIHHRQGTGAGDFGRSIEIRVIPL